MPYNHDRESFLLYIYTSPPGTQLIPYPRTNNIYIRQLYLYTDPRALPNFHFSEKGLQYKTAVPVSLLYTTFVFLADVNVESTSFGNMYATRL